MLVSAFGISRCTLWCAFALEPPAKAWRCDPKLFPKHFGWVLNFVFKMVKDILKNQWSALDRSVRGSVCIILHPKEACSLFHWKSSKVRKILFASHPRCPRLYLWLHCTRWRSRLCSSRLGNLASAVNFRRVMWRKLAQQNKRMTGTRGMCQCKPSNDFVLFCHGFTIDNDIQPCNFQVDLSYR